MATTLELAPLLLIGATAILYLKGWSKLHRRGAGSFGAAQLFSFSVAGMMLVTGIVAPFHHVIGASLTAHMLEHELFLFAPLLLVWAKAGTCLMLSLDIRRRGRLAKRLRRWSHRHSWLRGMGAAWAVLVGILAIWHIPALFDITLVSPIVHGVEHVSFFVGGLVYWSGLFGSRRTSGAALISIFGLMLIGTAAGALLTFASSPIYPLHASLAEAAGLDWSADQTLAGLIMWFPPGIALLATFVWQAHTWLSGIETRLVGGGSSG